MEIVAVVTPYPHLEAELTGLFALVLMVSLAYLVQRRLKLTRLPASRSVPLAFLLAVVVLISVESTLQLHDWMRPGRWYVDQPVQQPVIGWSLPPNLRNALLRDPATSCIVSTNSMGLRSAELPAEREPGEFRILCVGDSWTFGTGVAGEETFCRRLEVMLRDRLPRLKVSVINAGHPGFNYYQGYYLLNSLLPVYKPDLVMMCGYNMLDNNTPAIERAPPMDPRGSHIQSTLQKSYTYQLLRKEVFRVAAVPAEQPAEELDAPRMAERHYLQGMAMAAHAAGAKAVFFDHAFAEFPGVRREADFIPYSKMETVPYKEKAFASLSENADLAAVALCPVPSASERASYMLDADPHHPGPRGHARMATAIFALLTQSGFLPET